MRLRHPPSKPWGRAEEEALAAERNAGRPDATPDPQPPDLSPEPRGGGARRRAPASKCGIYLAWLCCGFTGLHHFLLERDSHAFLCATQTPCNPHRHAAAAALTPCHPQPALPR